jgi:hypothetical protein
MMKNYGENVLPNAKIFKYVRIKADGHSPTQQAIKLAAVPSQALCECLMYTSVFILMDGRYISVRVHVTLFFFHTEFAQRGFIQHAVITSPHSPL